MKPIIFNADYLLNPEMMDFNRAVEIHATRFFKDRYPLYMYPNKEQYNVEFENSSAYKVLLLSNEPVCSPSREKIQDVVKHSTSYNLILCTDKEILSQCSNAVLFPYGTTWLNKDKNLHPDALGVYYEGLEEKYKEKEFEVSFLATGNRGMVGYEMRHEVWNNRNKLTIPTKFWSSTRKLTTSPEFSNTLHDGTLPGDDKGNLFHSQFSIIIENCIQENYFSEKIIDCLLAKTIPIYFGCPNIGDFFNKDGIMSFSNIDELLQIVNSLNPNTYINYNQVIEENFKKAKEYGSSFSKRVEQVIKPKADILLSVGILTINGRENYLERLLSQIKSILPREDSYKVEILINKDNREKPVGIKRNQIINKARGKYICFIDDDDMVSENYFSSILPELEKDVDCVGFSGNYYVSGNYVMKFNHANKNGGHYRENGIQYRPINHLNPTRTSIVKQFPFPEINCYEDSDYTERLFNSKLIKSESVIDDIMYHYMFDPAITATQN